MQVAQVAAAVDVHPNMARRHLTALEASGLVSHVNWEPKGRGRPARRYVVTEIGRAALAAQQAGAPSRDLALAAAVAAHLASSAKNPGEQARTIGRLWGRQLSTTDGHGPVEVLEALGFSPAQGTGRSVELRTCPLLEAAQVRPDIVCQLHLGVIQGAAGRDAGGAIEPFARPGACVAHLP